MVMLGERIEKERSAKEQHEEEAGHKERVPDDVTHL